MNQGYTKETFKLKLHKVVTYYKVASIMEIIMGVGILALIAGAVAISVATIATFSGLGAGIGANLGTSLGTGTGVPGNTDNAASIAASLGEASNHAAAVAAAVVVVNGVFGFTFAISWLVKIVMLILAVVSVSELRSLAAANQKVLPFDPFIPGVLAFVLIIAVYFAWSRAHKLNLMADQLANDFQLSSQN